MAQISKQQDQLTVLVFKDNHAARVFRVPLRWISQLSWILSALIATVVIGLAVSSYILHLSNGQNSHQAHFNPSNSVITLNPTVNPVVTPPAQSTAPAQTAVEDIQPVVSPEPDLQPGTPLSTQPILFRGLPAQIQGPPSQIPITVTSPTAHWEGKTLKVHFGVQYTAASGSQQGRILILARGPGILLAHPSQLFYEAGHDTLLNPNQGEYFSVSRFRDTHAEFGPIANRESIHEVEIVLLSQSGQLLIHQMILPKELSKEAQTDGDAP